MVTDSQFSQRNTSHQVNLSWDQIVSKKSTVAILMSGTSLQCGREIGCLSNPYRYVAMHFDGSTDFVGVTERNPSQLYRGAVAFRGKRALSAHHAIHGGYRYYFDSWHISGHTADLSTSSLVFSERLLVAANGRASSQGSASFYTDSYTVESGVSEMPLYRTGDRELSGLSSTECGVRTSILFGSIGGVSAVALQGRINRQWYRYPNFSELPTRNAWVVGGGVNASY